MPGAAAELDRLRAALAASEAHAAAAEAELAQARAIVSPSEAMFQYLRLEIARLRRARHGQRYERRVRLLDQLELHLEDLEGAAAEDGLTAGKAAERTAALQAFERRRPSRQPFPAHPSCKRAAVEAPASCGCCGSGRLVKMGEDVTETLEVAPRR